jgi:D-galactarolactone cycloisomerase
MIRIKRLEAIVYRYPLETPVQTSFGLMQPDLAKWGGFSKTVPVARQIIASGKRYCPHCLGGGIGLVASAHALAAVGGDGMLEVDIQCQPTEKRACR